MNSVKILHAVRSAITAIAELLVHFFFNFRLFFIGLFTNVSSAPCDKRIHVSDVFCKSVEKTQYKIMSRFYTE